MFCTQRRNAIACSSSRMTTTSPVIHKKSRWRCDGGLARCLSEVSRLEAHLPGGSLDAIPPNARLKTLCHCSCELQWSLWCAGDQSCRAIGKERKLAGVVIDERCWQTGYWCLGFVQRGHELWNAVHDLAVLIILRTCSFGRLSASFVRERDMLLAMVCNCIRTYLLGVEHWLTLHNFA